METDMKSLFALLLVISTSTTFATTQENCDAMNMVDEDSMRTSISLETYIEELNKDYTADY